MWLSITGNDLLVGLAALGSDFTDEQVAALLLLTERHFRTMLDDFFAVHPKVSVVMFACTCGDPDSMHVTHAFGNQMIT